MKIMKLDNTRFTENSQTSGSNEARKVGILDI